MCVCADLLMGLMNDYVHNMCACVFLFVRAGAAAEWDEAAATSKRRAQRNIPTSCHTHTRTQNTFSASIVVATQSGHNTVSSPRPQTRALTPVSDRQPSNGSLKTRGHVRERHHFLKMSGQKDEVPHTHIHTHTWWHTHTHTQTRPESSLDEGG